MKLHTHSLSGGMRTGHDEAKKAIEPAELRHTRFNEKNKFNDMLMVTPSKFHNNVKYKKVRTSLVQPQGVKTAVRF